MDLKLPAVAPRPQEAAAVDRALASSSSPRRDLLLPALHAVQKRVGWVSEGALGYICRRLSVPPAEAYGVATFYALFSTEPRPARVAHVCDDIACRMAGAEEICRALSERLGAPGGSWHRSPCLGQCERAPAVLLQVCGDEQDHVLAPASPDSIERALSGEAPPPPAVSSIPQTGPPRQPNLRLLRRVGIADPESLDEYRAEGGYEALRQALRLGPEKVVREILDAKLVGRGGAAFPMGLKWQAVAKNPVRPHYVVANADESEPGTFKDRVLMEEDPFAVVEAMTIAGYAVGAEKGFLYIRGEYPLATRRLENALRQAFARGLLGRGILGTHLDFEIEIRRGAGAYICGEETALFNSLEGYRGEPRSKPPFPTEAGLFGRPTVVNNIETLACVLDVLLEGGPAFARIGTHGSTGHKLFCLSGAVARPGLYEVPFGTTLREVLALAGGVPAGRSLKAVLLGGAAGTFLAPGELDVPLTFEDTRAIGASLGSGVVMAFDDRTDLQDIVLRIARFFRDESCGQCVPCRVGTVRQEEALERLARKRDGSAEADVALLGELAQVMRDASICGLGQTAASAVQSALERGWLTGRGGSR